MTSEGEQMEKRGGGSTSGSSRGSSVGSIRSPVLHPSHVDALTNSVISNLDLSDDAAVNEAHEKLVGPSSILSAVPEQSVMTDYNQHDHVSSTSETTPCASNTNLPAQPSSSSHHNTSFHDAETSVRQAGLGADDSALNALMEAHATPSSADPTTPSRPSRKDASFGLDPDADTHQALHGQDLVSTLVPSPLSKHHHHHHQHHISSSSSHAPSHSTIESGAPQTTTNDLDVKTVPSVSATGVPRIWPRHASRPSSPTSPSEKTREHHVHTSSRRRSSSSTSSSFASSSQAASAPKEMQPNYAPSGSLTLAIFASGITWRRRSYLLLASLAINLGLPFLNGVMLGFGEIFARSVIAPFIGLAPAAININAPGAPNTGQSKPGVARVGLREAAANTTSYREQQEQRSRRANVAGS